MDNRNNDYRASHGSSGRPSGTVRRPSGYTPQYAAHQPERSQPRKKKKKVKGKILITLLIIFVLGAAAFAASYFLLPPMPKDFSAKNTVSGIKLTWKVDGEHKYIISKKTEDGWKTIKKTKKTAFTDKSIKNGENGTYRINTLDGKLKSIPASLTKLRITPVEITDTSVDKDSVTITWSGFYTAEQYDIFRRSGEDELELYATVGADEESFRDDDVEPNCTYFYAVRQKTTREDGPISKETSVSSISTKLKKASVSNSPTGVIVTWEGNTDSAECINIYRKVGEGKWKLAGTADKTEKSFTDKDAAFGKTAEYRATMKFGDGTEGEPRSAGSVYAIDPNKKLVALTYDDGPYAPVTNVILDTMEKYDAHCTFFVVGNRVDTYSSCVTRAVSLGCEIGSHTYEHRYFNRLSADQLRYQVDEASKVIGKYTDDCKTLRPPGGFIVDGVGFPLILWSVDTQDWDNRDTGITLSRAKNGIFDGSIVLMHDLYETSGQATVSLVPYLIQNGYQLVTVSELMEARGVEMIPDKAYYSARRQ